MPTPLSEATILRPRRCICAASTEHKETDHRLAKRLEDEPMMSICVGNRGDAAFIGLIGLGPATRGVCTCSLLDRLPTATTENTNPTICRKLSRGGWNQPPAILAVTPTCCKPVANKLVTSPSPTRKAFIGNLISVFLWQGDAVRQGQSHFHQHSYDFSLVRLWGAAQVMNSR